MNQQDTDKTISITAIVNAPIEKVWEYYNEPSHVTKWAFASDDWEAPHAENDLRTGGSFVTTMASKDGKNKFDFKGVYTEVITNKLIKYTLEDGRKVSVEFTPLGQSVEVVIVFEMESENTRELQQNGWQAILDNFKKHVEEA